MAFEQELKRFIATLWPDHSFKVESKYGRRGTPLSFVPSVSIGLEEIPFELRYIIIKDTGVGYLSLNQKRRTKQERISVDLRRRASDARNWLRSQGISLDNYMMEFLESPSEIGGSTYRGYYEANVIAIRYNKSQHLSEEEFRRHLLSMVEHYLLLTKWHQQEEAPTIEKKELVPSLPLTLAPELINTILAAAQAKRFLIFAGPTGTGKTAFFRELIRALGDKGRILTLKDLDEPESSELACYNLLHVPVRPDWTDPSELMGYTDLKGQYRAGILLKFLKLASQHTDRKFIFLLDEMNIAVVEHYFAPILSLMETMKDGPSDPIHVPRGSGFEDVRITDNVLFVGTVNIDDTTNRLSPKVLDRAFVIEFGVRDFYDPKESKEGSEVVLPYGWWHGEAGSSINEGLGDENRREVLGLLDEINKIYKENHLPFAVGYRTRDEILRFISAYLDLAGKGSEEDHFSTALDMAVVIKILPRLFGGEELREALNALKEIAVKKSLERTRAKIDEMLSRLEQRAYTSFWR